MTDTTAARRILVDWRAAIIAGLLAGALFLILNLLLAPVVVEGNTESIFRYYGSIVLGEEAMSPDRSFGGDVIAAAIGVHLLLSVLFALLVAIVVHRWGVIGGTIGGLLLGIAIYLINYYSITYFFPWLFQLKGPFILLLHIIYGAAVGALYEVLEREPYERAQGEAGIVQNSQ